MARTEHERRRSSGTGVQTATPCMGGVAAGPTPSPFETGPVRAKTPSGKTTQLPLSSPTVVRPTAVPLSPAPRAAPARRRTTALPPCLHGIELPRTAIAAAMPVETSQREAQAARPLCSGPPTHPSSTPLLVRQERICQRPSRQAVRAIRILGRMIQAHVLTAPARPTQHALLARRKGTGRRARGSAVVQRSLATTQRVPLGTTASSGVVHIRLPTALTF